MYWHITNSADRRAVALADRHYSRQTPGGRRFTAIGETLVLITHCGGAAWVTLRQKYIDHDWKKAWNNSFFRNETNYKSSDLILQALAATRYMWGDPPEQGLITFIDAEKIQSRNPGYCYKCAGFQHVGYTRARKLHVLQILDFPSPARPNPRIDNDLQLLLF